MTTQREPNHRPNINKVVTALAGRKKKGAEDVQNSDVLCGKLVDGRYKCLYLAQILALELTDALEACAAENLNNTYYIMPDPMCGQKLSKVKA